jgi:hypothetical protein
MGIYIEIKKIKTEDYLHYYQVIPHDFKEVMPFTICIDSKNNFLHFLKANNEVEKTTINLQNYYDANIDWLPMGLVAKILARVIDAVKQQVFPDYISHCS